MLDSGQTSKRSRIAKSSSRKSSSEKQPPHQGAGHEETPLAVNPSGTADTTESCEPTEHSGAPSSDMPFLTPEVTEDPEGRKSPNLSPEMPFLTLAIQSSDNNTLLNPNQAGKSTSPQKAQCPDWCLNPFQEDVGRSHGSNSETNEEKKDGDGHQDRSLSVNLISHQPKTSTELSACSSAKDSPLSANTSTLCGETSSTSYDPIPPSKPSPPLDESDFTSSALPNLFEESSAIWKNVSYQNAEVSELVPYAIWAEPLCQQVKCPDPSDFPEKSLTFTDLEPSMVHHPGAEHLGSPDRPQRSDSSSESSEESSMSESEYADSGAEPGEIRTVSTLTLNRSDRVLIV